MRTIDGQMFKMMVISASNNLYNHYPEVDALNVFPVPDGDTGMNMNLTMQSGAKEISNRNDTDIYTITKVYLVNKWIIIYMKHLKEIIL